MKKLWSFIALGLIAGTATAAGADDAPVPTVPAGTVWVKRNPTEKTWKSYPVRTVADLAGFRQTATVPLTKYGGRADRRRKATGFFRTEKIKDRWWLIDPDGGLFVHVGVVDVNPRHNDAFKARFRSDADWEKQTTTLLRESGFNGAGAWSSTELLRANHESPLVYTIMGNNGLPGGGSAEGFMRGFGKQIGVLEPGVGHTNYRGDCIPVFHPNFPDYCDTYARPLATRKSDPYLLGYFSDNEMPLPELRKYLALPSDDPATRHSYRAARAWWDARKKTKDAPSSAITPDDQEAWAEFVFDRYLAVTTGAIRKYDPHHLCLGSRVTGKTSSSAGVLRAAGRHLDVVAVNLYFVWNPAERVAQMAQWAGKPLLITEWYAKGMDSGFANTSGAGWTVPTQRDRGLFYETFTLALLESKECVGWHWFKYMDNDPNNKNAEPSNRDSNKGMVTNGYATYPPLVERMREVNRAVYSLADYFDAVGKGR